MYIICIYRCMPILHKTMPVSSYMLLLVHVPEPRRSQPCFETVVHASPLRHRSSLKSRHGPRRPRSTSRHRNQKLNLPHRPDDAVRIRV